MELDQIKELMSLLEKSPISKLTFKRKDFEIHLEKEMVAVARPHVAQVIEHQQHAAEPVAKKGVAGNFVTSPMVGTFYNSPGPDQPPFIKVGEHVDENTVVCIIEAMKVMNEVKAGMRGVVAEILVDGGRPVEFGTKLVRIT